MDTNYRSGADIVKQAGNLISFNEKRFEKTDHTGSRNWYSGGETGISDTAGTKSVCNTGDFAYPSGRNGVHQDMAVLFRTNMQPRFLMEMMLDYSIPFTAKDRIPKIQTITRSARDLFAYIRHCKR